MSENKTASMVVDSLDRPMASLRLSVTDRCNLRCSYCMPERDYIWLPREELLSFEEMAALVEIFTRLGVSRIRLTGGEPLLRQDLDLLVELLAANPRIRDLALTTNGVLLEQQAEALWAAGLGRLTVSLDTLRPERFRMLTRQDEHARVIAGLSAARTAGFTGTKIDTVVVRSVNDDELANLLEFGRANDAEVRFIEYMDVPGATQWSMNCVVTRDEMLARLSRRYGTITPLTEDSSAPARRFQLPDGLMFGIIASTSAPFCRTCDRSRLTADGAWYRCLYATTGTDLRASLRAGVAPQAIAEQIRSAWTARADRGAELRKSQHVRGAFLPVAELRLDPHLEMHTRGG